MNTKARWNWKAAAMAGLLAAGRSNADVLELRNGQVLTGKYAGGTAGTVRFESGGTVQVVEASQVLALSFTAAQPPAQAQPPAVAVPVVPPAAPPPVAAPVEVALVPAAPAGAVTVPAGTVLLVRMLDGASSNDPRGKRFATALQTDLVVNGSMAARAGTKVYGRVTDVKQAGRMAGASVLDLRLSELAIGGTLVPIMTGAHAQKGAQSLGKTAKGAAAGAAIGAIDDGSEGAGKGAAIGALVSGLKKGQSIVVPPGTLLEFQLVQPVTINTTR